jgi:hypothetical protein
MIWLIYFLQEHQLFVMIVVAPYLLYPVIVYNLWFDYIIIQCNVYFYYILEYVVHPNTILYHIHITLVTLIIILGYVGAPKPPASHQQYLLHL